MSVFPTLSFAVKVTDLAPMMPESTSPLSVLLVLSIPDPPSFALMLTECKPLPWVNGPAVGQASKVGAFLSTLMPVIGPAVVLLSALSKTLRLLVEAVLVSVPVATLVVRLKFASPEAARPERTSEGSAPRLLSISLATT